MALFTPVNLSHALLLALLLTAGLGGTAVAADGEANKQQLRELNQKIGKLKKSISSQQSERSNAAKALQRIEKDIGVTAAKLHRTKEKSQQQQRKLNELENRQRQLRSQQQSQKALIAEHVRSAYSLGKESQMKMLLNQEDPEKLSRTLTYFDYFNRARSAELRKYRDTLNELDTIKPAISAEAEALALSRRELEQQQQALLEQKQRRAKALAGLDSEISNKTSSLTNLDKQRKDLESILQAVEREVTNIAMPANYKPFKDLRGKMPWPINGKPLNRYGASRQGSAVTWQGIQLSGQEGDAVKAIHNGRVVFADWLRGAGLLIIVDHGGDYLSLYAHNQSLLRSEGDWVRGGEGIATVGNSGGQRQAGLYFEIRYKGRPTDPRSWCR
ncbi:murein hydrolase activator EnvC family protein [Zhongshania aliphaticivorans]|jgi:septal ring factor EnvC (AmiA/AmiB activator)|uniref:ATPase n=1 Tax=Zhongshania aliphaticivorans TaxID=1470434 RepID=A0A127M1G3_9GAMM|nr:peptidoglycan DD-metalloendopeptidase family protein [Zhongshania aliphaticivorans]AMO67066.1 ATPase [Zhongshania aliphaticivorans]|tara:strand:- start:2446 stop:3606 length:1161 start_codon:yes stop_codon:yes gene_type:complete